MSWRLRPRQNIRRCPEENGELPGLILWTLPGHQGGKSHMLNRTRLSLFYLGSYLTIGGFGLLFAPQETLKILQSNGDYGDVFPRVSGMLMSGLGLSIFGMIRARSSEQYPATLVIRAYFIGCLVAFYAMTADPVFLVLIGIVGLGFALTLGSYLLDRRNHMAVEG
jgi:hypothetical protein